MGWKTTAALGFALATAAAGAARGERLRIAVGQQGNWDTAVSALGQGAGIFARHGLDLDILYTQGGAETQQAVLARSADIGVAAGTLGALGAAARGAPLRIIAGETTGAAELYWYVPAASAVRTAADLSGRTVAFSTLGSSSDSVLLMAAAQDGLAIRPTATGGQPGTYTQVMSGQVDAGWAAAPFGLDQVGGKIRIVLRGADVKAAADETVRVIVTHAAALADRRDALERYLAAYRETLDWMYSSPDAIPAYAKLAGVPENIARRTRDEFFPKDALDPARFTGLAALMADGVAFKFLSAPLSPAQIDQIVRIEKATP